jgi:hypothetical protein
MEVIRGGDKHLMAALALPTVQSRYIRRNARHNINMYSMERSFTTTVLQQQFYNSHVLSSLWQEDMQVGSNVGGA